MSSTSFMMRQVLSVLLTPAVFVAYLNRAIVTETVERTNLMLTYSLIKRQVANVHAVLEIREHIKRKGSIPDLWATNGSTLVRTVDNSHRANASYQSSTTSTGKIAEWIVNLVETLTQTSLQGRGPGEVG
ncbi:hypothetical protein DFH29DRAFT_905023 [Suillus ampliporus]|nr:hypothetical protein DFH29DRAFT_905023 [Suillus ampliporus]